MSVSIEDIVHIGLSCGLLSLVLANMYAIPIGWTLCRQWSSLIIFLRARS